MVSVLVGGNGVLVLTGTGVGEGVELLPQADRNNVTVINDASKGRMNFFIYQYGIN